jgi:hypothetical protein
MNSVWVAAIWAGATVVIVALFLRRLGRPLAGVLEARRSRIQASSEEDRARALERQNEAELARDTAAERAEHHKAKLRQESAEANAAAEVAKSTIPAQIAAKEKVIAARAEGRALAAKDQAMKGENGDDEPLRILLESYNEFRREPINKQITLDEWLGDLRFVDGELSQR